MRRFTACILVIGLLIPNFSCAIREPNLVGRKSTRFFPESFLIAQAQAAYAGEKKRNPASKNAQHNRIVQRVGDRLITIAQRDYPQNCRGFKWEVKLFDRPKTVNAYCMPGGKIAFYTGILPICKTEAGVAAVMGHEISHALLNHGNERISRQLGVTGLMIGALYGLNRTKTDDRTRQIIMAGLGLGSQVGLMLPFGRKQESESDRLGLFILAKAGYDPSEAPEIWVRMGKKSKGQQPFEFLSTHPSHGSRIADLTALQPQAQELYHASKTKYKKGDMLRF